MTGLLVLPALWLVGVIAHWVRLCDRVFCSGEPLPVAVGFWRALFWPLLAARALGATWATFYREELAPLEDER